MNQLIIFKQSIRALYQELTRSLLTIIGITIGIAAIIVTFSIGSGAEKKVHEQILAMGENASFIIPGNIIERGTVRSSAQRQQWITEKDLESIKAQNSTIIAISRGYSTEKKIELAGNEASISVYGTDANMLTINGNSIQRGSFFNEDQVLYRVNVAVLGHKIARSLFHDTDPIGATVNIENKPFTVIGTMNNIEHFWGTRDPNDRVYIPFTVAKKYFSPPYEPTNSLGFIALKFNPKKPVAPELRKIKRILRFTHNIETDDLDDFTIFDEESITASAQQASRTIKLFGLITALIALMVGGIGIMNVMLVSVTERTKEIGIKLAIGATPGMIQMQFLFEAIILSCFGGILGIISGIATQHIISSTTELPGVIKLFPLVSSFLLTIIIGIFFGYYPAYKASRLNPVEALRES